MGVRDTPVISISSRSMSRCPGANLIVRMASLRTSYTWVRSGAATRPICEARLGSSPEESFTTIRLPHACHTAISL